MKPPRSTCCNPTQMYIYSWWLCTILFISSSHSCLAAHDLDEQNVEFDMNSSKPQIRHYDKLHAGSMMAKVTKFRDADDDSIQRRLVAYDLDPILPPYEVNLEELVLKTSNNAEQIFSQETDAIETKEEKLHVTTHEEETYEDVISDDEGDANVVEEDLEPAEEVEIIGADTTEKVEETAESARVTDDDLNELMEQQKNDEEAANKDVPIEVEPPQGTETTTKAHLEADHLIPEIHEKEKEQDPDENEEEQDPNEGTEDNEVHEEDGAEGNVLPATDIAETAMVEETLEHNEEEIDTSHEEQMVADDSLSLEKTTEEGSTIPSREDILDTNETEMQIPENEKSATGEALIEDSLDNIDTGEINEGSKMEINDTETLESVDGTVDDAEQEFAPVSISSGETDAILSEENSASETNEDGNDVEVEGNEIDVESIVEEVDSIVKEAGSIVENGMIPEEADAEVEQSETAANPEPISEISIEKSEMSATVEDIPPDNDTKIDVIKSEVESETNVEAESIAEDSMIPEEANVEDVQSETTAKQESSSGTSIEEKSATSVTADDILVDKDTNVDVIKSEAIEIDGEDFADEIPVKNGAEVDDEVDKNTADVATSVENEVSREENIVEENDNTDRSEPEATSKEYISESEDHSAVLDGEDGDSLKAGMNTEENIVDNEEEEDDDSSREEGSSDIPPPDGDGIAIVESDVEIVVDDIPMKPDMVHEKGANETENISVSVPVNVQKETVELEGGIQPTDEEDLDTESKVDEPIEKEPISETTSDAPMGQVENERDDDNQEDIVGDAVGDSDASDAEENTISVQKSLEDEGLNNPDSPVTDVADETETQTETEMDDNDAADNDESNETTEGDSTESNDIDVPVVPDNNEEMDEMKDNVGTPVEEGAEIDIEQTKEAPTIEQENSDTIQGDEIKDNVETPVEEGAEIDTEQTKKAPAIEQENSDTIQGEKINVIDDVTEPPVISEQQSQEKEDSEEVKAAHRGVKTKPSANDEFINGLDDLHKFLEEVDVPDELDVGATGLSLQEVLMGQGAQIVKTRVRKGVQQVRKSLKTFRTNSARKWNGLKEVLDDHFDIDVDGISMSVAEKVEEPLQNVGKVLSKHKGKIDAIKAKTGTSVKGLISKAKDAANNLGLLQDDDDEDEVIFDDLMATDDHMAELRKKLMERYQ